MTQIVLFPRTGKYAENKDIARDIRLKELMPALASGGEVAIDFAGIDAATQSFIHALISDAMRKYGNDVLDRMTFRSCNESIQAIITIVTEYMQVGLEGEEQEE